MNHQTRELRDAAAQLAEELKRLDLAPETRAQIEQAHYRTRAAVAMFDAEAQKQRRRVGLLDLKPRSEIVPIGEDEEIEVRCLSSDAILLLLATLPRQVNAIMRREPMEPEDAISAHWAIAMIIACATMEWAASDEEFIKAIEIADQRPADEQLDLLEAIGRVTFSQGFGPFVRAVIVWRSYVAEPGKTPAMRSPNSSKKGERTSIRTSTASARDNSPHSHSSQGNGATPPPASA